MSALRNAKWSFTSPKDRHFLCISHHWLHVETQLLELPPRDACLLENGKAISDWAVLHKKEPGSTGLRQVLDWAAIPYTVSTAFHAAWPFM